MNITIKASSLGFANVGQDVTIWPLAKIVSPEVISLGDSAIIVAMHDKALYIERCDV